MVNLFDFMNGKWRALRRGLPRKFFWPCGVMLHAFAFDPGNLSLSQTCIYYISANLAMFPDKYEISATQMSDHLICFFSMKWFRLFSDLVISNGYAPAVSTLATDLFKIWKSFVVHGLVSTWDVLIRFHEKQSNIWRHYEHFRWQKHEQHHPWWIESDKMLD